MADTDTLRTKLSCLHAVIIGIDNYPNVSHLRGAVRDAQSVVDYLCFDLLVPQPQITCLKNHEATRSNIIGAIDQLRKNQGIKPLDPILIYFAGHGCEQPSPLFEKGEYKSETQCIVPWDIGCQQGQEEVSAIPDYTLAALFYGVAKAKGNNITVILDACHSASSTRGWRPSYFTNNAKRLLGIEGDTSTPTSTPGPEFVESNSHQARLLAASQVPPIKWESDAEILQSHLPGDFGLSVSPSSSKPDGLTERVLPQQLGAETIPNFSSLSRSHVLLAACDHSEVAYESLATGAGCFTTTLLKQLRSTPLNRLTYRMCFNTFPLMDTPGRQSPVCEGDIDRFLFSSQMMEDYQMLIPIHNPDDPASTWQIGAGEAQGIIPNSKFYIHAYDSSGADNQAPRQLPITTFIVSPLAENPCRSTSLLPEGVKVPRFAFARLFERGEYHKFGIYITDAARSKLDMKNVLQPQHGIIQVGSRKNAKVVLDVGGRNNMTLELRQFGLPSRRVLPARILPQSGVIQQTLLSMAQWDWHLSRSPYPNEKNSGQGLVSLTMYKLEESGPRRILSEHEDREEVLLPRTNDLYGLEVTSRCGKGLHVYLFYYSTEQQSIRPLFLPVCSPGKISAPLKPNEKLTIGYGNDDALTGAILFQNTSDVGYFRAFATTCPGDFSSMTQKSPFNQARSAKRRQSMGDDEGFNDGLMIGNFMQSPNGIEPMMGDPMELGELRRRLGDWDVWDVAELKVRFKGTCSGRQRQV